MVLSKKPVKVSLIVPIYNAEQYLPRCLQSIISQDYNDYEVILIDDGSTDSSLSICQSFAKQYLFVHVFHQPNGGEASARNTGLANATGDYICWVDADDYVTTSYLSDLVSAISNDADLIIQSHIRKSNQKEEDVLGVEPGIYRLSESIQSKEFFTHFQLDFIGVSVSKLFKRSVIQHYKLRYNTDIRVAVDLDFLLRYLCFVDLVVVTEPANYYYLLREGSVSTTVFPFSDEQKGFYHLVSSWKHVSSRFPVSPVSEIQGFSIAYYVHRLILSCYKPEVVRTQRIALLKSIADEYVSLYKEYGPKSTLFLQIENYLFVHRCFSLLDLLLFYTYRIKYPIS